MSNGVVGYTRLVECHSRSRGAGPGKQAGRWAEAGPKGGGCSVWPGEAAQQAEGARGLVLIGHKAGSGLPCQERSRPGTRLTTLLLVRHAVTMACSAELTDKGGGGFRS
jgi:hypothetical protein